VTLATLVDWSALGKVVLYAFITTVGATAVFSLGIVGVVRYDESRRQGGAGLRYAALALVCALLIAAVVVEAILVMAKK
jgi:hypothetical protein